MTSIVLHQQKTIRNKPKSESTKLFDRSSHRKRALLLREIFNLHCNYNFLLDTSNYFNKYFQKYNKIRWLFDLTIIDLIFWFRLFSLKKWKILCNSKATCLVGPQIKDQQCFIKEDEPNGLRWALYSHFGQPFGPSWTAIFYYLVSHDDRVS